MGHLSKVCRSAQKQYTNTLDVVNIENILSVKSNETVREPFKIRVKIENKAYADMELDTGSAVSTIPIKRFRRVFPEHYMYPSDVKLKTATGEIFEPAGFVKVQVSYQNKDRNLKWYLIKEEGFPLLFGREWMRKFNMIPANLIASSINSTSMVDTSENLQVLLKTYSDLFSNEIGEIKDIKADLRLQNDAKPIFCKPRTVTYALRASVEEELQRLQKEKILKPVTTSKWATPIVPVVKPNGKIRICGDFKVTLNKVLEVEKYPLPKIEDILATLAGGIQFTKIDLNQAYLQLPVEEKCQELLTITTHKGLFKYTRLPYGVASSPAIWQRTIEQILRDIEGVSVFIDDICITGPTDKIHLERLRKVLQRFRDFNLKINKEKSVFMTESVTYCGYKIDRDGIHKTQEKVEAVVNAPRPENVSQVKAFLGLVSYYSRFIPNLSTMAYTLNKLLRKNVIFKWTSDCERAFNAIKTEITSDRVLTHFNTNLPLVLATDASSYGIAAVLSHVMPDNTEKPIAFASRTLTTSEKRYSQVDKEALSIIFGVKKYFQYLYGRRFTLFTDSKPLVSIFAPDKSIPLLSAARMQRYALYLQSFQYDIRYKRTTSNGNADALSRLPLRSEDLSLPDETEVFQVNQLKNLPITANSLAVATKTDPILKQIYTHLISGGEIPKSLLYGGKQEEFTLEHGCILKGCRVVIPEMHRKQILNELHSGHFGIVKMKSLARSFVWWPGIDNDIERIANNCAACINLKNNPRKVDVHHWEWPTTPWQRIHVDFAGPIMGKMLLIVVDVHSKWPEVFIVPNITTEHTINCLSSLFARYGFPISLVSDNGAQFTSDEFNNFLSVNGIKHIYSAPYHPATNGQAERYVQIIKRGLKALAHESGNFQSKLNTFLMQYRKMPHSTTGESPACLFLKRNIRTRIDLVLPDITRHVQRKQNPTNTEPRRREFQLHQRVAVRNYTPEGKWKIGKIIAKEGKLHYRVQVGSNIWRRHIDQITSVGSEVTENCMDSEQDVKLHEKETSTSVSVGRQEGFSFPSTILPNVIRDSPDTQKEKASGTDARFQNLRPTSRENDNKLRGPLRRSTRTRKVPDRLQYS